MSGQPWDLEGDQFNWIDEATGLPCAMKRHPSFLHWCGYVGVAAGDRLFGLTDSARLKVGKAFAKQIISVDEVGVMSMFIEALNPDKTPDVYPLNLLARCHGGITYAGDSYWPGAPAGRWWFGFDCGHAGDRSPGVERHGAPRYGVYRNAEFVRLTCAQLAEDLVRISADAEVVA